MQNIYFIGLFIVTIMVIYFYMINERDHRAELEKIERLERSDMIRSRELEIIRSQTEKCPIEGLNTPRSCYFNSNYQCSWNDLAERCDKKK